MFRNTQYCFLFIALLPLLWCVSGRAQTFTAFDIPVQVGSRQLTNAWGGGLNSPQVGEADFNRDGRMDALVFDRVGHVWLPYERQPDGSLQYAPQYIPYLPVLKHWMLPRDYDGDGAHDLFAYVDGLQGITVYKGFYQNDTLRFQRIQVPERFNVLYYTSFSGTKTPLQFTQVDYPEVADMDCDGDLDIIGINGVTGGYAELYKNLSVERGYKRDSLLFIIQETCWGGFYESGVSPSVSLAAGPDACSTSLPPNDDPRVIVRHAGSSFLAFDVDEDGDKDALIGDLSFSRINFLQNGGSCSKAWINKQDPAFPSLDIPVAIDFFPAAFAMDVDADGRKDILVAPNAGRTYSEDSKSLWWYKNTGPNSFKRQQSNLFQSDMIDIGSTSSPLFADVNADGLTDLIVGGEGAFNSLGVPSSRLWLFQNTGSTTVPRFTLVDTNYLQLSVYNSDTYGFSPCLGDMDQDGDLDILVGESQGRLLYAPNIAGAGKPFLFGNWQFQYMNIDVGWHSHPCMADINGDGLTDLLIGEQDGNVNYFQNTGTAGNPFFNPDPRATPNVFNWGKLDARTPGEDGFSAPFVFNKQLYLGTGVGRVERYSLQQPIPETLLPDTETWGNLQAGFRSKISLADLNDDGILEVAAGNMRGGISLYKTDANIVSDTRDASERILAGVSLWPNPTKSQSTLVFPPDVVRHIGVYDIAGRKLQVIYQPGKESQALEAPPLRGVYLVVVTSKEGAKKTIRWVVQ